MNYKINYNNNDMGGICISHFTHDTFFLILEYISLFILF